MYSRAERLSMMPDPDHANPKLGPGTYNPENVGQVWKKKACYAPFSSLSPRISAFDDIAKYTPAPGAYEAPSLPFQKGNRASFFGRSKAVRFNSKVCDTPGPGSYVLPSSLKLRSNENSSKATKLNSQTTYLNQRPVLVDDDLANMNIKDLQNSNDSSFQDHTDSAPVSTNADKKQILLVAAQSHGILSAASKNKSHQKQKRITWKRKHIPPSIPIGQSTFGYTEDADGELIPRNPPEVPQYTEPTYLTSFAEESKHSNKGYRFGKGQGRLTFKPHPGPAPNVYDVESQNNYLKQSNRGPAVMALAPCKRLTDEIVMDAVKKGIPGPGAYEVKARTLKISQEKNHRGFGEGHKFFTHLETPGPGSYDPEHSENSKVYYCVKEKAISNVPRPFGSTTKRFDLNNSKSISVPAPGSYELSQVNSLVSSVQRKAKFGSSNPAIAFGSFTERFNRKPPSDDPGPGQYNPGTNLNYEVKNGISSDHSDNKIPHKESKITSLLKKGPVNVKIGNVLLNAAQMQIPIFGTQTERFKDSFNTVPSPGSYDSEKAFERLVNRGKIETVSIMSSHQKQHDIYNVNEKNPGPGQYDPSPLQKKSHFKSPFVSSLVRFPDAKDTRPGPGAYDVDNDSLHRKTFNVTLTDWSPAQKH